METKPVDPVEELTNQVRSLILKNLELLDRAVVFEVVTKEAQKLCGLSFQITYQPQITIAEMKGWQKPTIDE